MSGILPNLVGLNKTFAAANPDDYLFINASTSWSGNQTINQPIIISPNATLTISSGSEITFNQDVIIYGKLNNSGTINYATNLYANKFGSFMIGDANYPNNGVVINGDRITGKNLFVSADKYPEPPFSYTYTPPSMGTVTIQGKTVPNFVVNIGGSEVTASADGTFSTDVSVAIGSNNFDVKVRNIFGREFALDPISIQVEDTSGTNQDTAAPTWSQGSTLTSSNITDNSVTLNWPQASDNNSISGYYIYQNGNQIDSVSADVLMYEVKGLTPANTYQFKIEAYDANWNVSTSGPSLMVRTNASTIDTQSPTWQTDAKLEASNIGDSSLVLNWQAATDDVNVNNYKIYKNGNLFATVENSTLSYTLTGLSPSTKYTFKVEAGDASGNWTNNGPSLEVTTADSVLSSKVTFPDSRVEDSVRSSIGKPAGNITKEDMLGLTSIYLSSVSNLAGLQYAKNLQSLTIERSYINGKQTNLNVLSNLTNLTYLRIYDGGLDNLSFLSGLTKLTTLELFINNSTFAH
jgi:chitodextrinase